jgi:hypothetical protein
MGSIAAPETVLMKSMAREVFHFSCVTLIASRDTNVGFGPTTGRPEGCTDAELLQASQEQHLTAEPGLRWSKNPAALSPVWLEKPERIAALAMLTVVGLLVYAVIQRQVRLSRHEHERQLPGNKGRTATPTAAVGFALLTPVMLVHCTVDDIPSLQVHGVQDYHRLICDAVGIAQTWYQGVATEQNSPPWTTPP